MKFSSRLLFGLFLTSFSLIGSTEEVVVIQSPRSICAIEGEKVCIRCCWSNTTKSPSTLKFSWDKNGERVVEEKRLNQTSSGENCNNLTIIRVTKHDSGEYVCKVTQDIPRLKEFSGNKTSVHIHEHQCVTQQTTECIFTLPNATEQESKNESNPHVLHLSLGAGIGLLTLCLAISMCKLRNSCKKQERMVIHQTPHSESEEHENMEEEKGSTSSSRGSLQWYQVPVYWSYFDLQRGED